jgi:hypothetical protein
MLHGDLFRLPIIKKEISGDLFHLISGGFSCLSALLTNVPPLRRENAGDTGLKQVNDAGANENVQRALVGI